MHTTLQRRLEDSRLVMNAGPFGGCMGLPDTRQW